MAATVSSTAGQSGTQHLQQDGGENGGRMREKGWRRDSDGKEIIAVCAIAGAGNENAAYGSTVLINTRWLCCPPSPPKPAIGFIDVISTIARTCSSLSLSLSLSLSPSTLPVPA